MKTLDGWRYKRNLTLILSIYLLLTIVSSICTPLYRGPDEPAHVIYVRSLAQFRFPGLADTETREPSDATSHEAHQPPLYYLTAAVPFAIAEKLTGSIDAGARAARAVSMALGAVWVYLVSLLTAEFFGKGRKALFATAFTAFIPMSAYIAGVVNNDIMACVTITWTLLIVTRAFKENALSRPNALLLGSAVGLSILAKAQGLVLLILITLCAVIAWLYSLAASKRLRNNSSFKQNLKNITLAVVVSIIVSAWWFIRNYGVYGHPVIQSLQNPMITLGQAMMDPIGALSLLSPITHALFMYFWAPLWVVDVISRSYLQFGIIIRLVYLAFWAAVCMLSAFGLVQNILSPSYGETKPYRARLYGIFAITGIFIYLSVAWQTLFIDKGVLQQGRLFLPLAGALGIVAVQGISTLFKSRTARRVLPCLGITLLILINLAFSYAVYFNYAFVEL